jgi:hypothetical protein
MTMRDPRGTAPGVVTGFPNLLLRAEGAALVGAGAVLFAHTGAAWWWVPLLFLVPDVSAAGYLVNPRVGAFAYNAGHTTVLALALAGAGWWAASDVVLAIAAIWLIHIGFDRAIGYGLKYPDGFGRTHLAVKRRRDRSTDDV